MSDATAKGAAQPRADCEAVEVGGVVQCDRCGLGWPAGAARPACFPTVTYTQMWAAIAHERVSLAVWQRVKCAAGGDLTSDQAERMAAFAAAMRLINLIADNADLQDEIVLAARALRGAANGK